MEKPKRTRADIRKKRDRSRKALTQLGLKEEINKSPTAALSDGIDQSTPLKDGTPFYLWHKDKTCQELDKLEGWERQGKDEQQAQKLAGDYASDIKAALKADRNGEHHVIVDGLFDLAQDTAKQIKAWGKAFVEKVNA
ncbi:MAG: hypothetical protein IGR93_13840 [Hydrococcus sp. C42_A2020_068]|uniref:hypothetical protein n=1 Tax=Pleurocapsa sp. PCC 7327 TaxID=118163 RepID=UPI00029FC162|nr:hypothetical protein [Pleurocapsa sp. PCC 7327]AFY79575.1 hypothetical protein Ple7327_4474 [Pleurocapsa sp. PCC 7327]MBF2021150.1 hypothetical protein [Hydrococcus sp. C42_A2020_068]